MGREATIRNSEVQILVGQGRTPIAGCLAVPSGAHAVIVFAHGSGSSRFSPRNRFVAGILNDGGFATLLADLLTPDEEADDARTRGLRFDVEMLGQRLADAAEWVAALDDLRDLPIGYFGASTGAAAALIAAARHPRRIFAIVSRGGRPDLAGAALGDVRAPTLLVVGGSDPVVLDLNRQAAKLMTTDVRLEIVPHATHLFEEAGALERVAALADRWFHNQLPESVKTANSKELP
jgi:pimeloyl-ACP methyl ester carboxylesterase